MPIGASSRRFLLRAALSLAAIGIAHTSRAADPIVIGGTISETGPFAVDALYQLQGMQLAADQINAKGGWLGRKLQLKIYDDRSEPGTAVRLYTRLITQDHVDLLMGPYSSGITQAMAPLVNKYEMVTFEPNASLPDIYVKDNKWNFQGTSSSVGYLQGLLQAAKNAGAKSAAILGLKSAYSLACYQARLDEAKQLGMTVSYQTTYSLPQPDFSSIALAIKNANPDVVIVCSYYPDSLGITQALHQQGFAPHYLAETIGPVEASYIQALGPLANRVISNTGWWRTFKTPGNQAFLADYQKQFKREPDYHAANAYSAMQVMAAAVAGTHSIDQNKLRDWILHNPVQTVQGTYRSDPNGAVEGFVQDMVQVQDGQLKLVWPEKDAEAKLLSPYTGK